ncbi:MAG: beta-N-acetylhexosaminidase [Fimbriimonadales bacterium]|nr:beta-N-acetylhexosaminidase [Fimbriimonadales bacterium]
MRFLAMAGLLWLQGAILGMAQPPAISGDGWEARPRGGDGVQLRINGVLLSRGSWAQLAAPDWSTGYYSSQGTPPTPQREGDTLTLRHSVNPELGVMTETVQKTAPDTLEWQLQVEWRSEKPAVVEWCLGLWHAEYLLGATVSGEGELATTQLSREPKTFAGDQLFSGTRFTMESRVARVELQYENLSILDGRGAGRWWSREIPTLWVGVLRRELRKGETIQMIARLRIQRKPLPTQEASQEALAKIEAVPDRWSPVPREPELIPPPKIVWRDSGEPFRLPTNDVPIIIIEDESFLPAADTLCRELERYGIRASIQRGQPQPNTVFIGGSPALQRQYPVPDQLGAYYLEVKPEGVKIVGRLSEGAFYGVQTLIQWLQPSVGALQATPVRIIDYPHLKWRGVHLFGSTQPDFLPRIIENVVAHAKFNHLVLECGYGQWETIRGAWVDISAPQAILREAVQVSRRNLIEPIPLIPSLGHMYWVFRNDANKHLAEDPETPWAIAPRGAETRSFLQRLYDEVFEVFQPRHFHVGLDEVTLRGRFPNRPESKDASVAELFVEHAEWLYAEMKRRGVEKVLMWGDVLLARGEANDGGAHAKSPEEAKFARERLSKLKDLFICDWHYTPTEPERYISLPVLQGAGFSEIIATAWYDPRNVATFAKAARQRRIAGLLQSTWAGYSLNERTLQGVELRQFVAYLIAGAYAWDTDLPMPEELPYDFERLFVERYYRAPVALQERAGFVMDLTAVYNYDLTQLSTVFAQLPSGAARFSGHRFLLRGARGLMLASYLAPGSFPQRVRLPLDRPVRTLYLLHTTGWQTEVGNEVGRIILEYTDDTRAEQPVFYGRHIRAWNDRMYALEGFPLWRVRTLDGEQATARLLSWNNPHPEKPVRAVYFVAYDTVAGWTILGLAGE